MTSHNNSIIMQITQDEAVKIGDLISPIIHNVLDRYDLNKYPKNDYERFKRVFSALDPSNEDIEKAMLWKWGHWGKSNFPNRHKTLIYELQKLWPEFVKMPYDVTSSSKKTFDWWQRSLNRRTTRYITVSYITHLIHHAEPLPIIDQHNYRAMNALINAVRETDSKAKKKPTNWADIQSLKYFMSELASAVPHLSLSDLDKFLMMYGRYHVNH